MGKKGKTMNPIAEIHLMYFQVEISKPVLPGKDPCPHSPLALWNVNRFIQRKDKNHHLQHYNLGTSVYSRSHLTSRYTNAYPWS